MKGGKLVVCLLLGSKIGSLKSFALGSQEVFFCHSLFPINNIVLDFYHYVTSSLWFY